MIELPEALTYKREMNQALTGKIVEKVWPPSAPHKFCWFSEDAGQCDDMLRGKRFTKADAFGIFAEISFEDTVYLAFNDVVNVRLLEPGDKRPGRYQLLIDFTDGSSLVFSVAMYGSIICHHGDCDNEYYVKSREGTSPLSPAFDFGYFSGLIESVKPSVSAKAFLATEQRIPGLGNGCLQDILLACAIHPRRKLGSLSQDEREAMFNAVRSVIADMAERGGRDTEKDLFGKEGGYPARLSKKTLNSGCPVCGQKITKETYMGGAVYYCPVCQTPPRQ